MNRIVTHNGIAHLLSEDSAIQMKCWRFINGDVVETDDALRAFALAHQYECCLICETRNAVA